MRTLSCLVIPGDPLSSYSKEGNFEQFIDRFKFYADNLGKVIICNFDYEEFEYSYPNLEVLTFKVKRGGFLFRFWMEIIIVRRLLKQYHLDFMRRLDSPIFLDRALLGLVARLMRKKVVISIHGGRQRPEEVFPLKRNPLKQLMLFMAEKIAKISSNIALVVDVMYFKELGWSNIHLVPNFVDSSLFYPQDTPKEYDMIYVGTLNQKKGIKYLLEAFKLVKEKRPLARLAVCGSGELKPLVDSVRGISYLGPITHRELAQFYNKSKVFVTASLHEGFCVPIVEAQACQVPVVAFDLTPFHRNTSPNKSSFLVPLKDSMAMSERIIYLLNNEAIRKDVGARGRMFVKQRFDKSVILENEISLIRDLYIDDQYQTLEVGRARHLHRVRMKYLMDKISEIKNEQVEDLKILDIGCGDGIVSSYILKSCSKKDSIIGIDSDVARIRRAKKNCPGVQFISTDASRLPFPDNYFDIVISHHVIEHVRDDRRMLAECSRVLKLGSYFILGTPNEDGVLGRILRWAHPKTYKACEHIHFYSAPSMKNLLKSAGFQTVEIKGFGFLFPCYSIHNLILGNRLLFTIGNFITQRLKNSADSIFFLAKLVAPSV